VPLRTVLLQNVDTTGAFPLDSRLVLAESGLLFLLYVLVAVGAFVWPPSRNIAASKGGGGGGHVQAGERQPLLGTAASPDLARRQYTCEAAADDRVASEDAAGMLLGAVCTRERMRA